MFYQVPNFIDIFLKGCILYIEIQIAFRKDIYMKLTHTMTIAGLKRDLPICPVNDSLSIGAFIILGDAELTVACAAELLKIAPEYDYLLTSEAKSIPLIHEMARQSGAEEYFVARKGSKVYMTDPYVATVNSITTAREQHLYLGREDAEKLRGKRVLIVDDVISTGDSLLAMEKLCELAGAEICGKMAILAEGEAADRKDIIFLEKLPLFHSDGSVLED